MSTYRVGRKLGRTLYLQRGREASGDDVCLGMLDDPGFAEFVADVLSESELEFDHGAGQVDIGVSAIAEQGRRLGHDHTLERWTCGCDPMLLGLQLAAESTGRIEVLTMHVDAARSGEPGGV